VKFCAIANICKYKGFHEGHHFILMTMEVVAHPSVIWIVSSKNVFIFSTIDDRKVIYPCLFTFSFSGIM